MSKRRKIIAGTTGVAVFAYIVVTGLCQSILWPVTGVNQFHYGGMIYDTPRPKEFPDRKMCHIGSVIPGLGWFLGSVYAKPDYTSEDQAEAGNACSFTYNHRQLYVKRGNNIKSYVMEGYDDTDKHIVGHAEQF